MPIIGILDSAKTGNLATGYNWIASTSVTGASASELTFSNIPASYNHLRIVAVLRSARTFSGNYVDTLGFYLNGGGMNRAHATWGDGFNRYSNASVGSGLIVSASSSTNATPSTLFALVIADIYDYKSNAAKTIRTVYGFDGNNNSQGGIVGIGSTFANQGNPITSVGLYAGSGNLLQNSKASLYGIA